MIKQNYNFTILKSDIRNLLERININQKGFIIKIPYTEKERNIIFDYNATNDYILENDYYDLFEFVMENTDYDLTYGFNKSDTDYELFICLTDEIEDGVSHVDSYVIDECLKKLGDCCYEMENTYSGSFTDNIKCEADVRKVLEDVGIKPSKYLDKEMDDDN